MGVLKMNLSIGYRAAVAVAWCLSAHYSLADEEVVVASDAGVSVTAAELRHLVDNAPRNIRSAIQASDADRFEIVASTLLQKKIRAQLEALNPEESTALFYRYQSAMLAAAQEFDALRFQVQLELPDLEPLALERYRVSRNEVAVVPEQRFASHILLLCTEDCDRGAEQAELQALRDRALDGESFADLATEYSQDPGSRQRGGRFSQPITRQDPRIDETFRDATFALQKTGDISEIVESRFGFHLIRLEDVVPQRVYSFEEIKVPLLEEVEKRYREDAYREYTLSLGPTETFMIDYQAIDAVLGPVVDPTSP